jgi:hypothetical protein
MPKRSPLTLADVRRFALALPGVEEGPCYGTPGFRAGKKLMLRMWEDGEVLVVKCGDDERDRRLKADPETFFVTDHYKGYPAVLVHLSRVSVADLRALIEIAWRRVASKRMLAEFDAER